MHQTFSIGSFNAGERRLIYLQTPLNQPTPIEPQKITDAERIKALEGKNGELTQKLEKTQDLVAKQAQSINTLSRQVSSMPRMENGRVIVPGCEQYQPYAPNTCACGYTFTNRDGRSITRIFKNCGRTYNYAPVTRKIPQEGDRRTTYSPEVGMHWQTFTNGKWEFTHHVVDEKSGIALSSLDNIREAQRQRQERWNMARAEEVAQRREQLLTIRRGYREGPQMGHWKHNIRMASLNNGVDQSMVRRPKSQDYDEHALHLQRYAGDSSVSPSGRFGVVGEKNLTRRRFNHKTGEYEDVSHQYRQWKNDGQPGGDAIAGDFYKNQRPDAWRTTHGLTSDPKEQQFIETRNLGRLKNRFDQMYKEFKEYGYTYRNHPKFGHIYTQWEADLEQYDRTRKDPDFSKPVCPGDGDEMQFLRNFKNLLENFRLSSQTDRSMNEVGRKNKDVVALKIPLPTLGRAIDLEIIVTPFTETGTRDSRMVFKPNKLGNIEEITGYQTHRDYNINLDPVYFDRTDHRTETMGMKKIRAMNIKFGKPGKYELIINCWQPGAKIYEVYTLDVKNDKKGIPTIEHIEKTEDASKAAPTCPNNQCPLPKHQSPKPKPRRSRPDNNFPPAREGKGSGIA